MTKLTDFRRTIIALATALGTGSIAVIRISGNDALKAVSRSFRGKNWRMFLPILFILDRSWIIKR